MEMEIEQRFSIAAARSEQEVAPESPMILPPRTQMARVLRSNPLNVLKAELRNQGGHRGHRSQQQTCGPSIRACAVPCEHQGMAHKLSGRLWWEGNVPDHALPVPSAMLLGPAPPLHVLESDVDQQERALCRTPPGARVQAAPEAARRSDELKAAPGSVSGEPRQHLDAALVDFVDKAQRMCAGPLPLRQIRHAMAGAIRARGRGHVTPPWSPRRHCLRQLPGTPHEFVGNFT